MNNNTTMNKLNRMFDETARVYAALNERQASCLKTLRLTNRESVKTFLSEEWTQGKSGNLKWSGNVLYSYSTPIAKLETKHEVLLNNTKYSRTTSTHQNLVRKISKELGLVLEEVNYYEFIAREVL